MFLDLIWVIFRANSKTAELESLKIANELKILGLNVITLKSSFTNNALQEIFLKKDEKSTLPYYLNNFLLVYIAYLSNFGSKTYSTRALPSSTKIIKNPIRRTFQVNL